MENTYNYKKNDVCRRCLGEGVLISEGEHIGHGNRKETKEEKCSLCKGSGLVQIEKKIEVFITPKTPKPYLKKD